MATSRASEESQLADFGIDPLLKLDLYLRSAVATAEPPPTFGLRPDFDLTRLLGAFGESGSAPLASELGSFNWSTAGMSLGCLGAACFFATLRYALRQSHAPRILGRAGVVPAESDSDCEVELNANQRRLSKLLKQADPLATSASILSIVFRLLFLVLLLLLVGGGQPDRLDLALTVAAAIPLYWLANEALPLALAKRYGDSMLVAGLQPFYVLQWPLGLFARLLDGFRKTFLRALGLQDSAVERQILEGLREVVAESELDEDLDETEREIIGNVMEIGDVDVVAVMTPRTEVIAVVHDAGLLEAARAVSESGYSRIPVYEENLDTIIGTFSARDLVQLVAKGEFESTSLKDIVRPSLFVPETKEVPELLEEFRRDKIKMAIVLDEYGGTAGLVTLSDILAEIVGEIQDEFDEDEPSPIRRLENGTVEVDAGLHVTEVNEELELDLPEEEDYETLAGFVLSQLGRFPKAGEGFEHSGHSYSISEANDRRVLKVCVKKVG